MKYPLLILFLLMSVFSFGQYDTTKMQVNNYWPGFKYPGVYAWRFLDIPLDTVFTKFGIARKGSNLYVGNGTSWRLSAAEIDTTVISTRNWRQKGIDSLAAVIRNQEPYDIVYDGGADPTGSVDAGPIINTALANGHYNLTAPDGTFLINTSVQMHHFMSLIGSTRGRTTFVLGSNITFLKGSYALGGIKVHLADFTIQGTWGSSGNTNQKGIVLDSCYGAIINNVGGYFMAGFVVTIKNNGLIASGNKYLFGNTVTNCYTETCYGGILADVRGEYNIISNNKCVDGTYGFYNNGGNNAYTGNVAGANGYNYYWAGGSNNAHGIFSGNIGNHGGTANLYVTDITIGQDFDGNAFYAGNITLLNSDGISIRGGTIEATTITVTSCTNTNFWGVRFYNTPTWTVTGNSPGVYKLSESSTDGITFMDPKNSTQTSLFHINGVMTYGKNGSSLTQQHKFYQPIVGKNATFDATRDASFGTVRFDANTSSFDPWQFYNSNASGRINTWLASTGDYYLYALSSGKMGLGIRAWNSSPPTAYLHFAAGTATASTAPEKFTSGTLNTTPEAGAKEFNASFYSTKGSGLRYGEGGIIKEFYTDVANSGTTETDLYSYTLPANTLANTGEKISAEFSGEATSAGTENKLRLYFGGTEIFLDDIVGTTGGWRIYVTIYRTGANTVRCKIDAFDPVNLYVEHEDVGSLTFSGTLILKVTGKNDVSGSTITAKTGVISWYPVSAN